MAESGRLRSPSEEETALGEIAMRVGACTRDDLQRAVEFQRVVRPDLRLGMCLVYIGALRMMVLDALLAHQRALRCGSIGTCANTARKLHAITTEVVGDVVRLASAAARPMG